MAAVEAATPLQSARLHFTTDTGEWGDRTWQSREAVLNGSEIKAELPAARPLLYFLTVTDRRGATVSTDYAAAVP